MAGQRLAAAEPLGMQRSWPLFEQERHFDLGCILSCAVIDLIEPTVVGELNLQHAGCWECDLRDDSLTWSGGVYDIFGLPRDARPTRAESVGFYCEESRAAMERLRSYSIAQKVGFTLDARIRPASGGSHCWMRLIGVPVFEGNGVARLHGLKLVI